jgi:hypothetical protein
VCTVEKMLLEEQLQPAIASSENRMQ